MAIALSGLAAGVPSASAEDDPFDWVWQQQTELPPLSITIPDISGRPYTVGYVDIDGYAVTEGDIVIGTPGEAASGKIRLPGVFPQVMDEITDAVPPPPGRVATPFGEAPARSRGCRVGDAGTATTQAGALWPERTVPFVLSPQLPAAARTAVEEAMKDFHIQTCVHFVPRTTEESYLNIVQGHGCYSYVGRVGGAGQELSIGPGCEHKGIAIHELMHALGFYHEHSRSDRDGAVTVHLENVIPGYESQFRKLDLPHNRLFGTLDYDSVMLYGRKFFSSNGQDTLVPALPVEIGQRKGFSKVDLAAVRGLYGCP
ncbi:M12 family metallopeptidase [Sphaerisporangium sp. NPDC051017]|uniref:M12 family metallopeptidase n=1 Tax=Sphaerisporangium sp. NPDC051017 TaxID=3154636 RepID=UPI0034435EF1